MFATTGLGRFGIPNLVITQAGRPLSPRWLAVVEGVVQRFMEGGSTDSAWRFDLKLSDVRDADLRTRLANLASANAKRAVRVALVPFVPPDPSLSALDGTVELTFPTLKCKGPDSCGQLALVELFGPASLKDAP